jgi:hypothetical protein
MKRTSNIRNVNSYYNLFKIFQILANPLFYEENRCYIQIFAVFYLTVLVESLFEDDELDSGAATKVSTGAGAGIEFIVSGVVTASEFAVLL